MKAKTIILLAAVLLSLSGCSSQAATSEGEAPTAKHTENQTAKEEDSPITEVSLEAIYEANEGQKTLNQHDYYTETKTYMQRLLDDASYGEIKTDYVRTRWDGQIGVHAKNDTGSEEVWVADERYYVKEADGSLLVGKFIDDGYFAYRWESFINSTFELDPDEIITATYYEGDLLVVETEYFAEYIDPEWYGGKTEGTLQYSYYIDPESYLIYYIVESLIDDDGNITLIAEATLSYDGDEAYPLPEFVNSCEDTTGGVRKVTRINDPGTPNEKSFVWETAKGVSIMQYTVDSYSVYTDPECTEPFEGYANGIAPDEITIYCIKDED